MRKSFTITISIGGRILDRIIWEARDEEGVAVVRLTLDDLIRAVKTKADSVNANYEINIYDERKIMTILGEPNNPKFGVDIDDEEYFVVDNRFSELWDVVSNFVGR